MPTNDDQHSTRDRVGPLKRSFQKPHLEPAWTLLERLAPRPRERLMVVPARDAELVTSICSFHREGQVTCLEANRRLARVCSEKIKELDLAGTRVRMLAAAYHAVPTPGGQDALICHCHMPVIRELAPFLGALRSNLRPGGRFCLQLPLRPFCQVLEDALYTSLDRCLALPARDDLCPPVESTGFLELLKEQGLRQVETEELIFMQAFDSVMGAADTLLAAGGWEGLEELEEETREELLTETRLRLNRELETDGPVELPFLRLLVWGRR